MEKYLESFAEKVMPIANAIGSQRHMQAVRNGLISILPLTIVIEVLFPLLIYGPLTENPSNFGGSKLSPSLFMKYANEIFSFKA